MTRRSPSQALLPDVSVSEAAGGPSGDKARQPHMSVPPKSRRKVTASSGDPRLAIDDRYATAWITKPSKKASLKIDLGAVATLGGLEVYWASRRRRPMRSSPRSTARFGRISPARAMAKAVRTSLPSRRSRGRFVRWTCESPQPERGWEAVELNLYAPALRYPGAKRARADGRRCDIRGEVISAPNMNQLVIDF